MARRLLSLVLLVGANALAQTAPPIRPGLWETTPGPMLLDGKPMPGMADMKAQLEKLPPQMRAQMQERMQKQGMQFGSGSLRTCISAEMLKREDWGQPSQGRCKMTVTERSGSTWRWKSECSEPKSQGEGVTQFSGDSAYRSEMRWTSERGGKKQLMQTSAEARWLSNDCGGIAPLNKAKP